MIYNNIISILETDDDLRDYKFFCCNGKVGFFKIDYNRQIGHRANYYTPDGLLMKFGEAIYPPDFNKELEIPAKLSQMIELANSLASNLPFARIDFYNINGNIYFGEITFYPASGFGKFTPENYNEIIGDMISLPI